MYLKSQTYRLRMFNIKIPYQNYIIKLRSDYPILGLRNPCSMKYCFYGGYKCNQVPTFSNVSVKNPLKVLCRSADLLLYVEESNYHNYFYQGIKGMYINQCRTALLGRFCLFLFLKS